LFDGRSDGDHVGLRACHGGNFSTYDGLALQTSFQHSGETFLRFDARHLFEFQLSGASGISTLFLQHGVL
jgi:hypothetical protein